MDPEMEQRLRLSRLEFQPPSSPIFIVDDEDECWNDRPILSQALFSPSKNRSNSNSGQSLLDLSQPINTQQHNQLIRQCWDISGQWIHIIQTEIEQIENDDILGHAIIRGCTELADMIAHIISQLTEEQEQITNDDSKTNAANTIKMNVDNDCMNDQSISKSTRLKDLVFNIDHSLLLQIEGSGSHASLNEDTSPPVFDVDDFPDVIDSNFNRGNIDPVPTVIELLSDIESALRAVEPDEANDIADAAITVGHLLIAAMQQIHSQFTPTILSLSSNDGGSTMMQSKELYDYDNSKGILLNESPNIIQLPDDDNDDHSEKYYATTTTTALIPPYKSYTPQRVRCLWSPLQPTIQSMMDWTQCEVIQKQPWYITTPIVVTCWPILTMTAMFGGAVLVSDHVLQSIYTKIEHHPIIVTSEISFASLIQSTKLTFLTCKAICKPTIRVMKRQIQRHTPTVQESIVYHIHHPIETIKGTIQGIGYCSQHIYHFVHNQIHDLLNQHHMNKMNDDVSIGPQPIIDTDRTIHNLSL
jgi:hypothetical protein